MKPIEKFEFECKKNILDMGANEKISQKSRDWINSVASYKYVYNFKWMGRPIIQLPMDIVAIQELIWDIKPDLIIETGIAHGGSIIFSASILELIGESGEVVGIDIDIREHNRIEIENHPMYKRITMIEGSSIERNVIEKVKSIAQNKKKIMVMLDSCHTHEHVLKELELYSQFVTKDSYLIVMDTAVEFGREEDLKDREWGIGNNPWTAVEEFLKDNDYFEIDKMIENKLLLTSATDGYLKRIKE